MKPTLSYKDLVVWQKAMELVSTCYQIVERLPSRETYALGNQIIRSSVSIPSNIAEGYRRHSRKEYIQFCGIASGSTAELETQLLIVKQNYPNIELTDAALAQVIEVQKILYSLIVGLKRTPKRLSLTA